MALDFENYDSAIMYGATVNGDNLTAATVPGSAMTFKSHYLVIATSTTGPTAVSVFGSGNTAGTNGSITGFFAVMGGSGSSGSAALWGTTAGTIAIIGFQSGTNAYIGYTQGTGVLNAALVSGDTLQVSSLYNSGTFTCYTMIQTTQ